MGEGFDRAKAAMLAENQALRAETFDIAGTHVRAECQAIEIVFDELMWRQDELDADFYLDSSSGQALRRLTAENFNTPAQGATSSVVSLQLTRTSTTGALSVDAGTVVTANDGSGTRFVLNEPAEWGNGVNGAVSVEASSHLAGPDQNVDAGVLTVFDGGAPETGLTVTNLTAAAGGNPRERDDQLRERARNSFRNARRGTVGAIRDGALAVDQVRVAAAHELLDGAGNETGFVSLNVGDEEGGSNQTLEDAVDLNLDEYRAAGVGVVVSGATVSEQEIDVTVTWRPGQATSANRLLVKRAIVAAVNRLQPYNGSTSDANQQAAWLTVGLIEAAARSVAGIVHVAVNTPVGTVVPATGNVIRTSLPLVTVS